MGKAVGLKLWRRLTAEVPLMYGLGASGRKGQATRAAAKLVCLRFLAAEIPLVGSVLAGGVCDSSEETRTLQQERVLQQGTSQEKPLF